MIKDNEIFYDSPNYLSFVWKDNDLVLFASLGAPAGTLISGVDAADIASGHLDFNEANNQNATPIPNTDIGLSVPVSTNQGDGTANTRIAWSWEVAGNKAKEIDGFFVQILEVLPAAYTGAVPEFPAVLDAGFEGVAIRYVEGRTFYSYVHNGVMNQYLRFAVTPFRFVDKKISAAQKGYIFGTTAKSTGLHRPYDTLRFDDVSVSELKMTVQNVTDDNVIEPREKLAFIKPYLSKISNVAGSNSEYLTLKEKITKSTLPAVTKTTLTSDLDTARNNLNSALNSDKYEILVDSNKTKPRTRKSYLMIGTDENDLAGNTTYSSSLDNWKKEHYIANKAAFNAKFDAYDTAVRAVEFSLTFASSSVSSAVFTISDLLFDVKELSQEYNRFKDLQKKIDEKVASFVGTVAVTTLTTAMNAFTAFRENTLGFTVTEGIPSETANISLKDSAANAVSGNAAIAKGFKFQAQADAVSYLSMLDAVNVAYSNLETTYTTLKADLNTAFNSWDDEGIPGVVVIKNSLRDFLLTVPELSDIKNTYSALLDLVIKLQLRAEDVELALDPLPSVAALTTLVNQKRYTKVGSTTYAPPSPSCASLVSFTADKNVYFTQITEMTEVFNTFKTAFKALITYENTIRGLEVIQKTAYSSAITDFNLTNSDTNTAAISGVITYNPIEFISIDKGEVECKFSWASTILDTAIDGYAIFVASYPHSNLSSTVPDIVNILSKSVFVAPNAREVILAIKESFYVRFTVVPYRYLSDSYIKKDKTAFASRYITFKNNAIIYKPGFDWNGAVVKYETKHLVQDSVPSAVINGDYWLNSSVSTLAMVPPFATAKYDGLEWVVLTDAEAEEHRKDFVKDRTKWMVTSATEPLRSGNNVVGFYWKNSSSTHISGVGPSSIAFWDAENGLWDDGRPDKRYKGTAVDVTGITQPAYDGALYIATVGTERKLYKAQNGVWTKVASFTASQHALAKPAKNHSGLRYLDTNAFKYYTRTATTKEWVEVDIFTPIRTLKASSVLILVKG